MKCIILCAGYATRLQKYIKDKPKALISINNKAIIDYLIDKLNKIDEIQEIFIITNNLYYKQFLEWKEHVKTRKTIKVINDGTNSSNERLGAIGDIKYVIDNEKIEEDILVMASDNFFEYELKDIIKLFHEKEGTIICMKKNLEKQLLKRLAVVTINNDGKVIKLVEKPENPEGNNGVFTNYVFPKEIIGLLNKYLEQNKNSDAPGHFIQWLYQIYPVYAYEILGECYDIGTYDTLMQVRKKYVKKEDV